MMFKKIPDKSKIEHFDFEKRPRYPIFLLHTIRYILCYPDLKKRNFRWNKYGSFKSFTSYLFQRKLRFFKSG